MNLNMALIPDMKRSNNFASPLEPLNFIDCAAQLKKTSSCIVPFAND
eukprot:CAMPEP_0116875374 /NCGR_PEP_ID=MMETSP0463-20121206/7307_1 /TAXON_ID=181622 /ORGANISM="Strombidinopsis sp, Strain SopsisLIS2011" /LENGTH=46 /DNA_ID= /DNA_START= /DNA_END= /DNA_ORIENTATION=